MNEYHLHISKRMFPKGDQTVYLAISGGVDSVVLLDILAKKKLNIHLLHVNYHLRGEDSNTDENLIHKLAEKYEVQLTVLDFDMQKHLSENGGNLQNEARKVRYDFFQKHIGESGILMTAHHFDDQMETFFMHLSRKSGIAGMSCMAQQNGNHWRPLLEFRKSELYDCAKENNLEFREDESNSENKYLRNRWRNEWIPKMEKENPNLAEEIGVLIEAFQNERKELEKKCAPILDSIGKYGEWTFDSFDNTSDEEKFLITKELGLRATELPELNELRITGKSKRLEVKREGLIIWNDGNSFMFSKSLEFKIPELAVEAINKLPESFDKKCIYLDADKIHGELKVRSWQEGDRIASLGMKGTQLVSDITKDAKISSKSKSEVFVVCDDQEILWVVELKIGRTKVATIETENLLVVKVVL